MSDGLHLLDIVFFAMVAAFLVLRLRSVLGRRTGTEQPPPNLRIPKGAGDPTKVGDNVIYLAGQRKAAPPPVFTGPAGPGLTAVATADPTFSPDSFLAGARSAFAMIIGAYAAGDSRALRPLLSDAVYGPFAAAIDARTRQGERLETQLQAIRKADIIDAGQTGSVAHVTVRFTTEQINVVKDAQDRIIDGTPGQATEIIDEWTFSRDVRSPNPNWELVATRSPEN